MIQSLESTQYQAALVVLGAWKGSSEISIFEELGWESLFDRRWFRRLCQFYKIKNEFTPLYLKEAIPQPRTLLYGQRRENVLHEIPCRTTRFFNSFYPDTFFNAFMHRDDGNPHSQLIQIYSVDWTDVYDTQH